MRNYLNHVAVAALTFTIGAAISTVCNRVYGLLELRPVTAHIENSTHSATPTPAPVQKGKPSIPKSLSPFEIAAFINSNPQANLSQLWERLGVPSEFERAALSLKACGNCQAEVLQYDFDQDASDEIILRIGDQLGQAYRYLVFKSTNDYHRWKLLGHIDAWGKYADPVHTILLSGDRSWLVIRDQGATGSGVVTYVDRIFLVNRTALIEGPSYVAEGHQYGIGREANREFGTQLSSSELKAHKFVVQIECFVEYGFQDPRNSAKWINLFARKQKVTLVRDMASKVQYLNREQSDISQAELEAVYNIDSLYDEDFLKYNYQELADIATGRNAVKKDWLREFLKTCENTIEARRLSQLLAR